MGTRRFITMVTAALLLAACDQAQVPQSSPVADESAVAPEPRRTAAPQRLERRQVAESVAAHKALGAGAPAADMAYRHPLPTAAGVDRENYAPIAANGVMQAASDPVSTFSIDVDTGAYANVRRMLYEGRLPPRDAVRVEELVNYFRYDDPVPVDRTTPFRVTAELAPTPWNPDTRLLRVALKAWDLPPAELPASNLVFLVDVSGSMQAADKLPLLKRSLKLLTQRLRAQDRLTLVVYAGAAGVVLEPTAGDRRATIEAALEQLEAGGSTHGSAGIRLAYAKAREAFIADGINRVILATDGDFNVGTVDQRTLLDLVAHEREAGIALTTLGFGRGNLNDSLMEQLADHGNGNYAYVDTLLEAHKVLVEQVGGTLLTVAKDVKIQVEFNPSRVAEYRLIGYENRLLRREDFNNDRVDAGEMGAGHSVVALYELSLVGSGGTLVDALRYRASRQAPVEPHGREFAFIKLRYKLPQAARSTLFTLPVDERLQADTLASASEGLRFSAAVAAFAQQLRGAAFLKDFGYQDILSLARAARGSDPHGHRADFIRLVALAESLASQATAGPRDDRNG